MGRLALSLLGPFEATLDGEPVRGFESAKVQALLAYLAVEADRPHRRDSLAALLWPDRPDRAARNNLRRALGSLRKTIGDRQAEKPFLLVTREMIQFDTASDHWLDVQRFAECVAASGQGAAASLEEAVALYRGSFLEGFSLKGCLDFDDWSLLVRERLHRQALAALSRLAEHYERRGEMKRARETARQRVDLEPWQEKPHRQLMRLLALGGQRGEALAQYKTCRRILRQELGVDPERETTLLYERIRDGEPLPAVHPTPPNNLPAQLTPFVGREAELAAIGERLADPACRLLTLVGPGGSGKTRLALQAAADILSAEQLDSFDDGVFFVSLAPLRSVDGIIPTVAAALGLALQGGGDPRQQLLGYLRRKHLLLILDNFEHLLSSSPPLSPARSTTDVPSGLRTGLGGRKGGEGLVIDILQAAPDVKILITSRATLRVQGEWLYPVGGMNHPDSGSIAALGVEDVDQYGALKLFLTGVRGMQPDLDLTTENLTDAAQICRLVEGMPLGILLAAGWVQMLSLAEIVDEIGKGLDFLETDLTGVPERQRSMRAVFDHSWNLLTERQRRVFEALSVFRGGFTRQAAERITGASLRELKRLVDRSLVQYTPAGRYEMHELMRQYAAEKLELSSAASEAAHDRHCAYYITALQQWEGDLKGPRQQVALAGMDLEIENARAAWDWALARDQVQRLNRAIEGMCRFYDWRGRWPEGEATCEAAAKRLEGMASVDGPVLSPSTALTTGPAGTSAVERPVLSRAEGLRVLARCLMWQGYFRYRFARLGAAAQLWRRSLALLESPELADEDVRAELAFALYLLGLTSAPSPELRLARFEQSAALYRAVDDAWGEAHALRHVADIARVLGAYARARELGEKALALCQTLGDPLSIALALINLTITTLHQGPSRATHGKDAARRVTSPPLRSMETSPQRSLTHYEEARAFAERGLAICREVGLPRETENFLVLLGHVELGKAEQRLDRGIVAHIDCDREAQEAYIEAQRLARECAVISRKIGCAHDLAWALAVLAVAARGLGNSHEGWQCLGEALQIYAEIGYTSLLIELVPATALFLADAGEHERAVDLYALASCYPFVANSRWFEDVFGRHIDAIAATLPPEVTGAARERGRGRDLEATVKELLAELE